MWRTRAQIVVVTAVFLATLGGACELKYLVVDTANHRVQLCAPGAACTTVAGTGVAGAGATQLNRPNGILIHEDGDYVVTDTLNHRVQKCPKASPGAACTTVAGTGSAGAGATQLNYPLGTVIHEDGDYVITDRDNHRVQKCPKASPGAACTTVAGTGSAGTGATQLQNPRGILIHEDGDYVITDTYNHRVQKCPKASPGAACTTVAGTGVPGAGATQLNKPRGTVIHEDGDYVITDMWNHRVQKCPKASPGAACTTVAGTGVNGAGATQLQSPRGTITYNPCPATTTTSFTTSTNATTPTATSTMSTNFLGVHPVTTSSSPEFGHAMIGHCEARNLHWMVLVVSALACLEC